MVRVKTLSWIVGCVALGLPLDGCKTPSSRLRHAVSTSGISGVVAPGKGFDLRSRELTENVCVVSQDPPQESSLSISSDDSSSAGYDPDPNLNLVGAPGSAGFIINFAPPQPSVRSKLSLAGEQSGRSQIDLFYAHTLRDLLVSLDTTTQYEMGGSRGGGDLQNVDSEFLPSQGQNDNSMNLSDSESSSAEAGSSSDGGIASGSVLSKFRTQLQVQFKDSKKKSFILLHGIKTFPTLDSDTVRNPKFNPMFVDAIFGGNVPANEQEAATTYNEFRKYCGDYYVESVIRGREVWLVAVMESSQFNSLYKGSGDMIQGGHAKVNDLGELKTNMKAQAVAQNSNSFLSQKVEIKVASRGKINMNMGNFTFEEALDKFNMFLNSVDAASSGAEEGALEVSLRSYDNVRYIAGSTESRLGNVFTTEVKNRSAKDVNVLTKLVQEAAWADKEHKLITARYRWGQWSLDDSLHNGVAKQAKALASYRKVITDVLQYCGQIRDEKNASEECLAKAKAVASRARPTLMLPKPYEELVEFWFPEGLVSAIRSSKKIDTLTQVAARDACKKRPGGKWVLPNGTDWKRMVETSYFYSKWNAQTPGYRLANDPNPLSLLCGSLNSITFWSDEPGLAVQISPECAKNAVSVIGAPPSFLHTRWFSFNSELRGAYACVRYRTNND